MDCRLLTTAGQPVQYDTGGQSTEVMHAKADGAAVIPHPTDGGWYYTSNSEAGSGGGGVGTLRFNAQGEVIGYKMDLENTSRNCGGGKTYWNTWVTCEENGSSGFCWEVDPFTGHTAQTNAVIVGGNYESFAYDDQDPDVEARFFTTEDSGNGPLVRYTPAPSAFNTTSNYDILTSDGGTHEYLVLNADGTFDWSSDVIAGETSASDYFPNAEGIDVINRQLFFVSKVDKELFELDLAAGTWVSSSTVSGAFDKQPDQIQKVVGDNEFLYFCEDGGSSSDVHGRNSNGDFFTIVRGDGYGTETTGLAFSPNNKFMYVAFQGNSNVYAFWRTDGLDFGAVKADIKYHQV
jgi:secreted PhoX family phosphatase